MRSTEYAKVFKRTYAMISKDLDPDSLIVITGDILHYKTDLNPEAVDITYEFLKKLSEIAPVIFIPGNHDCNLSNRHRLDSLSPIVRDRGNNMYYLKDSGFYQYYNIVFGVTSIFDPTFISADKLDEEAWDKIKQKNKYKIHLYHGAVHSARTDVGFRMNQTELVVEDFDGYDYALLGDIHKFQYMDRDKTIAYAGSLIQQSWAESIDGHGFLKWDLMNRTSKFYPVKNDYGYCTVKILDGKIDLKSRLVPKPRIRFILENTNQIQYQEVLKSLETQYEICEIVKDSTFMTKLQTTKSKSKSVRSHRKRISATPNIIQENVMREYLVKKNLNEDKINSLMDLHKKISKQSRSESSSHSVQSNSQQKWKLLKLKFSNTLSYGNSNVIDFRNYEPNQIIGIMAPNRYGKSAILDIILFCLFDKMSRGDRRDILNKNENKMSCSLLLGVGKNFQYLIERIGQRSKNGLSVKIDVDFYMIKTDSKGIQIREKLNGLDKNDTNKKITDLIGTYSDYLCTCFCLQSNKNNNFIDMTQLQKKEYLHEILKLNVYEKCHTIAKDKLKELVAQEKLLEQQISKRSLTDLNEGIVNITKKINHLNKEKNLLMTYVSDILNHTLELYQSIPLCHYADLAEYNLTEEKNIINSINKLNKQFEAIPDIDVDRIMTEISVLKSKIKEIDQIIETENIDSDLHARRAKVEIMLKKIVTVPKKYTSMNLSSLENERDSLQEKISSYSDSATDPNDKLQTINQLKNECDELKRSVKNTKYSEDDLRQKLTSKNEELQHVLLEMIDFIDRPVNLDIDKINYQMQLGDSFASHLRSNANDLSTYLHEVQIPPNHLLNILNRDQMWLDHYSDWKTKAEWAIKTKSPKKMPDSSKLIREIETCTLDLIASYDNIIIRNKIKKKELLISDLTEACSSEKILRTEQELLNKQLTICLDNIVGVTEHEMHLVNNNKLNEQIVELKKSIDQLELRHRDLLKEKNLVNKTIGELENIIESNQTNISLRAKLSKHIKLLNEHKLNFVISEHRNDLRNMYLGMKGADR